MKKILRVTIFILSIILILSSCGEVLKKEEYRDEGYTGEKVKIVFTWSGTSEMNDAILRSIDLWNSKKNKITVVANLKNKDEFENLDKDLENGKSDIYLLDMNDYYRYSEGNYFADIKSYTKTKFRDVDQTMWNVVDDNAVPFSVTTDVLVSNTTMLDELGVEWPDNNETWDTMYDICMKIKDNDKELWGMINPLSMDISYYEKFLLPYNLKIADEKGSLVIDNPEIISFLREQFGKFIQQELTVPVDRENKSDFAVFEIDSANNLLGKSEEISEGYNISMGIGASNIPSNTIFLEPISVCAISEKSEVKEASVEFLQWLLTDEEAIAIRGIECGIPSSQRQRNALLEEDTLSDVCKNIVDLVEKSYLHKVENISVSEIEREKFRLVFDEYREKYLRGEVGFEDFLKRVVEKVKIV